MTKAHIHVPFNKLDEHFEFIARHRLNLEIYFGSDSLDALDTATLAGLRDRLGYSPSLSLHAPFMDLSPGAVDSKVRRATIERFRHVLDIAETLRPKSIVFHSGYEKWKYALKIDTWLEKSIETWQPLNERAESLGAKIAIENVFEDDPENLASLMVQMDSPNFGVCFDTGHCNLFSRVPLSKWMDMLGPYLIELHLHDNDGTADQHLPLGEGTFDFGSLFSAVKGRNCIYTLEAHTPERVMRSAERLDSITGTASGS
ncbi:MAG: sugar phosphate isomerase/epimerase family protein [Chloroflexota bacterium]